MLPDVDGFGKLLGGE